METLAANFLKFSGSFSDHRTVMFGSGDGPMVYRVFRKRKLFLVTRVRPSTPIPPIDSVAQIGSPGEQFIIFRSTQEANHTQFHDQVVNHFLCVLLGDFACFQVTFDVRIQEGGYTTEGHCCARSEI
ncbi:Uncharacterised protein [Salmonella enterica subsp. enterica]|nr:Uncharacterised protein [Salmonella enterica subsp. enterica]